MGFKHNGVETEGLPTEFIKRILQHVSITHFVESGTAGGDSINAAKHLFKQCHTIELIPGRYVPTENSANVSFYTGDSPKILPNIIKNISEEQLIFFWLDAHYSDSVPSEEGVNECPVLEELAEIAAHQKSIILIDDARLFLGFQGYPLDPRKWPKIQDIFETCKRLFPSHTTTIMDDYILCYPYDIKDVVESEWRERFGVRYPDEATTLRNASKKVYNAFKKYVSE